VRGGQAALEVGDDAIYLAVSVRNVGGQRVISQFILRHQGERCLVSAGRHFQLDQPDPREEE